MSSNLLKSDSYINGQWVAAASGKRFAIVNPASGETLTQVPDCNADDAEQAIQAAHQAFPAWAALTARQRAQYLKQWFEAILAHSEELATLMTRESGKPLAESRGEVTYGAGFVEWFAEEAKRVYGDIIPAPQDNRRLLVIKQPVGVCVAITPWNFPLAMITRKCAPALAAGCTVVVKPPEATPLTALALAALAEEAGIPSGVFNIVTTHHGAAVGERLVTHPLVRKISFTGSTGVGKLLLRQAADTVKRVSMELGGNAPFIVFEDADIDAAVEGALASKYRNTGQTCVCANRLLVHAQIADAFSRALAQRSAAMVVGNGLDANVQQGPLINAAAVEKVISLVDDAVQLGAKVLTGGRRHSLGGNFYEPTVITGITSKMRIASEEIFGPVAPIMTFTSDAEAIALANATPYGLAAYFYTRDIARAWRVAEALECGMVGINEGLISTELAPFGGVKESGLGREGSKYGIDEYLEIKYVCMGGINNLS